MYSRVYGLRCYSLRAGYIVSKQVRYEIKNRDNDDEDDLLEWLGAWIASEDLAAAHRLLMEKSNEITPFGCYNCMNDDTIAFQPTMDLINKHRPDLIPLIREPLPGHTSFFTSKRLKEAVGWSPKESWR